MAPLVLQHARESGIFAAKQALGKGNGSPYTYTPYFYSRVFDLGWEVIAFCSPVLARHESLNFATDCGFSFRRIAIVSVFALMSLDQNECDIVRVQLCH